VMLTATKAYAPPVKTPTSTPLMYVTSNPPKSCAGEQRRQR
jgi:hypothetical protein